MNIDGFYRKKSKPKKGVPTTYEGMTNRRARWWIARAIKIKSLQKSINEELKECAVALGTGIHRSRDHAGIAVQVSRTGRRKVKGAVDYKSAFNELCERSQLTDYSKERLMEKHRKPDRINHPTKCFSISVGGDSAKNPISLAV